MPALEIQQLSAAQQPLIVRFYRAHNSRNRVRPQAQCWVARRGEIVGGLCLTPVASGHFLTGLLVAPSERNQGIGAQLVECALRDIHQPVWLFCQPRLYGFYARLGFTSATTLPEPLADRLARYQQTKTLIALQRNDWISTMPMPTLTIAIACLFDNARRILIVRKRGSRYFMLPGGKAEAGETPVQTLQRELLEELGLQLEERDLQPLGHYAAPAANEPGHWVEAEVFQGRLTQAVQVQAELEELDWLELPPARTEHLAPLLRERILPVLLEQSGCFAPERR
ncbi:GNAT family N-acetyltransferase [Stutzerimonas stutzeri]|uniref:GNAT family N-acetyltransferase n=1 Tax=Stutzerimonas sp. S1 TaxID=3030652 RepID=UPI002224499F|nr:GNAT family N-acetyltransferase [Stutzerimonas sp. S1]MCW3149028.1 GNAT family N-acetyltransferase [Stutzerimonas sp. S1]